MADDEQIAAQPSGYACPNGHPFPAATAVRCEACEASVTCVPFAQALRLHYQLREHEAAAVDSTTTMNLIGEGLHTALRKGCDGGGDAWQAIHDLPDGAWTAALSFLVSGLRSMGYELCELPR
jgi:hypothetical protein